MAQTGLHYSEKIRYFVENLIFPVISVKSVKMNNFPLRNTKRYCITVKNWYFSVISVDFSNISKSEQFFLEKHWSVEDLTGETSF